MIAPVSWEEARLQSEAAGGYLATVTSQEENDWVVSNMLPLVIATPEFPWVGPWIGGYQNTASPFYSEPGGGWTWVTGETWSYTNWSAREPNDGPTPIYNHVNYFLPGILGDSDGWNDNANSFTSDTEPGFMPIYSFITETIPEPSRALLSLLGLGAVLVRRRR